MTALLVLLLLVVVGVVALKFALRPHTSIAFDRGSVHLERGDPPRALISDLGEVARGAPNASGRVLLTGRGSSLEVDVRGLDDGLAQQIRNVVGLHRTRIK